MKFWKWIVTIVFFILLMVMRHYDMIFLSYGITKSLDMSFGYTSGDVYHVFQLLGDSGKWQLLQYYGVDFIFIICFAVIQVCIIKFILGRRLWRTKLHYLIVIPLLRGAFDLMENAFFVFLILRLPAKFAGLVPVMSFITQMKFVILYLWLVSIVALGIVRVIARNRTRTNNQSI